MALGSTQPLTEMSTRNLPGGKGRPALKADCLENVRASTSHNPMGLHGLLKRFTFLFALFLTTNSVNVGRYVFKCETGYSPL
jgi:hypothetical protein